MRAAWGSYRYLTDPHTAVAMATAQRHFQLDPQRFTFPKGAQEAPVIVLATAHAAKFEEAVKEPPCRWLRALHLDCWQATHGAAFWDEDMTLPQSAKDVMVVTVLPPLARVALYIAVTAVHIAGARSQHRVLQERRGLDCSASGTPGRPGHEIGAVACV